MRRTLASVLIAAAAFAGPASARDIVDDLIGDCMDCVPPLCQVLNSCAPDQP